MITIRKSSERGHFDHGWLDTHHTFSFADYYDPAHHHFRSLRVINEDRVAPGEGFPTHSHQDMEIITYILKGALEHKDSLGTGSVIRPGEIQKMSAGTGVTHSEYNPSKTEPVHLLQIWIIPEKTGLKPDYQQKKISNGKSKDQLTLIASHEKKDKVIHVSQNIKLYSAVLGKNDKISYVLAPNRYGWVQVARGSIQLNGQILKQGDGAAIEREKVVELIGEEPAEALLFDLN